MITLLKHERENLEQDRRTRKQSLRAWLYMMPCCLVVLSVLTWIANQYFGQSFDYSGVFIFTACFSLPQYAYELWRLREIDKQLG